MADGSVIIDSKLDSKGLESGLAKLGSMTGSAMGTAAKGIAAVSAGLAAAGGLAASVGMQFDSAMSQVAATMGKTVDEIQILSDAAKEMGATTKFSATEAAQALNYLALAGYDAEKAADALPAVLNLAAAGGLELGYAADLATDAMAALGIEATNENLTHFGDQLAMTASKANTSVAQLGEAILTVGGTAKSLKGGTTELAAALGVLANRGIKGAEGGTHLRNVILALTAPTKKSADAMKALGVSATDAKGNMRPLNEILGDLNTAMEGMTDAQKTEMLNQIFNKTDIAAVQGLLAGCGEEWNNLAENIENAGGAMQQMADTQIDNLEGDITILKSSLEGLGIAAYEGFRAPLREMVQLAQSLVGELSSAMTSGGFEGLASALGDVLARGIDAVAGYAPKVIQLASRVIKGLCDGLKKNVKQIAGTLKNVLVSAVSGIAESLPALIEAGMQIMAELLSALADALPTLIPTLVEGIGNAIAAVASNAGALISAGIKVAEGLFVGLLSAIPALVQSLFNIIGGVWKSITRLFSGDPPETTVKVKRSEPDGKISDLKLDLEKMQRDGFTISVVVKDGKESKRVELQSVIDKDGKPITLWAECNENGDVTGFITTYNGVETKHVALSATAWDNNGAGELATTITDAHGNEITLTAIKNDNGDVTGFMTSINGLKSDYPISVTCSLIGVTTKKLVADLKDLEAKGVKITTTFTEDGATESLVQLQSFVDENGNEVQILAKCDPTGQVKGFVRTVNGITVDDVDVKAVADDGSITLAQQEIKDGITAPECKITVGFTEGGAPSNIQTSIEGIKGKSVKVTGVWSRGDIPETVDVNVMLSDSKNTRETVEEEIKTFKKNYASQAIDIQVQFKNAQPLINELETIQRRTGVSALGLLAVSGFKSTMSGMSTDLGGIATQMEAISNDPKYKFTDKTKSAWHDVATDISGMSGNADSLLATLSGLEGKDAPDMAMLRDAATNATTLHSGLLTAAANLDELAKNPNLQAGRKTFLTESADAIRTMAEKVEPIATELNALSGKTYLTPEDKERMVELTTQLTELYPELKKYVGEDGILSMEAAKVRELTQEYRNLALAKAASAYVADAAAAVAALELEQEKMQLIIEQMTGQNTELEQQNAIWEQIRDQADAACNAYIAWNQARTFGDSKGEENAIANLTTYLKLLSQLGPEALKGVPGFETLTDSQGNLLSPEEILASSEAMAVLGGVFDTLKGTADLNLEKNNEQIKSNAKSASDAQKQYDKLTPSLEKANGELDRAVQLQEKLKEELGLTNEATGDTAQTQEEAAESAETMGESLDEAADSATEAGEAAGEAAEEIKEAGEAAKPTVEDLTHGAEEVQTAAATLEEAVEKLTGAQTKAETLKTQLEKLEPEAKAAYDKLVVTAQNTTLLAQSMVEACKGAWNDEALAAFLDVGLKIVETTNQGIENNASEARFSSSAGKLIGAAKDALKSKIGENGSKFNSVGKMIAKGIAEGLKQGKATVEGAISEIVKAALEKAKKEAGIESPSKLFRDEIGQWIPKGIAIGVDENAFAIADSVTRAMNESLTAAESFAIGENMRAAVAERSNAFFPAEPAEASAEMDYDALGAAIWSHMPEDLSINQTVNFNRPMQAPDEIAREMRQRNTYGLIGGRR